MKKTISTIVMLLSTSFLGNIALAESGRIVATYKGGEVTESQVMEQFKPALEMQPAYKDKTFADLDSNLQEALVRGFVNVKLLEQAAVDLKIESTKEFQDKLSKVKQQLLNQEVIDRRIKEKLNGTMVDDEYKKLVESLKDKKEVKVAHILLDSKEKADNVKKKLSEGGKFNVLAKKFSKDEDTKARGGDLGYIMQGQLVPEFEEKAFAMKPNEVSDPVKTQFGWHIIKVGDQKPVYVPTKEEAQQGLNNRLSKEIVDKYFSELAEKANLKLNLPPKKAEPAKADMKASGSAAN